MTAAIRQAEYESTTEEQLLAALADACRYRAALEHIEALGKSMAIAAKSNTAAAGYLHLSGLASDALEEP